MPNPESPFSQRNARPGSSEPVDTAARMGLPNWCRGRMPGTSDRIRSRSDHMSPAEWGGSERELGMTTRTFANGTKYVLSQQSQI